MCPELNLILKVFGKGIVKPNSFRLGDMCPDIRNQRATCYCLAVFSEHDPVISFVFVRVVFLKMRRWTNISAILKTCKSWPMIGLLILVCPLQAKIGTYSIITTWDQMMLWAHCDKHTNSELELLSFVQGVEFFFTFYFTLLNVLLFSWQLSTKYNSGFAIGFQPTNSISTTVTQELHIQKKRLC